MRELERVANLRQSPDRKGIKLLVVEDAAPVVKIESDGRTAQPFPAEPGAYRHLTRQREQEWAEMQAYLEGRQCPDAVPGGGAG